MKQPANFRVIRRNYGHWDICVEEYGRAFAIRGGPGAYYVRDDRLESERKPIQNFSTVQACMSYICDLLMWELLLAEGQEPHVIEAWNVSA